MTNLFPTYFKRNLSFYLLFFWVVIGGSSAIGQEYLPIAVSGFTNDVIANGVGSATSSISADVDGVNYALVSKDFKAIAGNSEPNRALPTNGIIQNGLKKFQLANYSNNNSLRLDGPGQSGTLTFVTPRSAKKVCILGVSGSGQSIISAKVNFSDGSFETNNLTFPDWYSNTGNIVATDVGRVLTTNNDLENGPKLHENTLNISAANENKQIQSITFTTDVGSNVMNILAVSIELVYCTPEGTNSARFINNFSTTGGSQNITNNGSGFSAGGYGDFTNMTVSQEVTGTVNFSTNIVGGTAGFRIWVDWNQDGIFDSDNEVAYNSSSYSDSHIGSFVVPIGALAGQTRMRVVSHWLSNTGNIDPCATGHIYGEFEDYTFNVIPLDDCSGTPTVSSITGPNSICALTAFDLVLDSPIIENGITYQWQSSPAGANAWANISGATQATYTVSSGITSATDYKLVVTCAFGGLSSESNVLSVAINLPNECYCEPVYTNGDYTSAFSTSGASENVNFSATSVYNYQDLSATDFIKVMAGTSFDFSHTYVGGANTLVIWVDWNQNGNFNPITEEIFNEYSTDATKASTIIIPHIPPGNYRLRLRSSYSNNLPNPCSEEYWGSALDFTIVIIEPEESCDMIYVDGTNGSDSNQGTAANPVKTLSRAMLSVSPSRNYIKMTTGTYAENTIINLQDDLVIDGRYTNNSGVWSKSSNTAASTSLVLSGSETINNNVAHVMGFKSDGKSNWKLIDLNIATVNASGNTSSRNGMSNYAVYIANGSANYEITRCDIVSGNASNGQGRNTHASLFNGGNGGNGSVGATGSGGQSTCNWSTDYGGSGGNGGPGGAGGANAPLMTGSGSTGSTGGKGGRGKDDDSNSSNGTAGSGMTETCSGGGGALGANDGGNNDEPYGGDGSSCTTPGASGTNATTTSSTAYLAGYFVPGYGSNGTSGNGGGGGAGGGGGGKDTGGGCASAGGGGSGGSGGGGGGGAGAGGRGGGSSFGIFIWNAGASGRINHSAIHSGNFGVKGTGGLGGNGGLGGAMSAQGNTSSNDGQSNRGGRGGAGSKGGDGGAGADGTDGERIAIAVHGGGVNPTFNNVLPAIAINTSPSGGTVLNSPIVSLNEIPNKICQNSVLNIETTAASWDLPNNWEFVKYNSTTANSEFTTGSTIADITTSNNSGFYDLTANGVVFNSYLNVRSERELPVITVNPSPICDGETIDLSATSWGTETDYKWEIFDATDAPDKGLPTGLVYSSSDENPTGITLTAESTPKTYIIRYQVYEECCGWSVPVFEVITVNPLPTPTFASISPTANVCIGTNITYSTQGGKSNYTWTFPGIADVDYTVVSGGTSYDNEVVVAWNNASAGTIISVNYEENGCVGAASANSTAITLPNTGNQLAGNESATCYVNGTNPIHFYNQTAPYNYIGSINPQGREGVLTMTSYLNGGGVMDACDMPGNPNYQTAYMERSFTVNGMIDGDNNLNVYFPFTEAELNTLIPLSLTGTPGNPYDDVSSIANLVMTQYSGGSVENGTPLDNCIDGSSTVIPLSARGDLSSAFTLSQNITAKYGQVDIPSFSEFYFHGQNEEGSPLPVTLTDFSVSCDKVTTLKWTTASEQNSDKFIIEKSRDGVAWTFVAEQSGAGNSNTTIHYSQTDNSPWSGVSYYRLRQIDYDGKEEIYGPITVSCDKNGSNISVYPNPNSGNFTVEINSSIEIENADLQLVDVTGKLVSSRIIQITKGVTQVSIGEKEYLSTGTYILKIVNKGEYFGPVKVVVK